MIEKVLSKRTILGIDVTSREEMWIEISHWIGLAKNKDTALQTKQDECNKKQARIEQLETQAGIFVCERNEAGQNIRALEARIEKMTAEAKYLKSELDAAEVKVSKADQPRNRGKFSGKHDKPAK